eukprot:1063392-Pleurochrysis_carterae.AAC.1
MDNLGGLRSSAKPIDAHRSACGYRAACAATECGDLLSPADFCRFQDYADAIRSLEKAKACGLADLRHYAQRREGADCIRAVPLVIRATPMTIREACPQNRRRNQRLDIRTCLECRSRKRTLMKRGRGLAECPRAEGI